MNKVRYFVYLKEHASIKIALIYAKLLPSKLVSEIKKLD